MITVIVIIIVIIIIIIMLIHIYVQVGAKIAKLEKKKLKAVQSENYDLAKDLKVCFVLCCIY